MVTRLTFDGYIHGEKNTAKRELLLEHVLAVLRAHGPLHTEPLHYFVQTERGLLVGANEFKEVLHLAYLRDRLARFIHGANDGYYARSNLHEPYTCWRLPDAPNDAIQVPPHADYTWAYMDLLRKMTLLQQRPDLLHVPDGLLNDVLNQGSDREPI